LRLAPGRASDIRRLADKLTGEGHQTGVKLSGGRSWRDWYVDIAPYRQRDHIKLLVSKQWKPLIATSIGLIIREAR
jgi:hypothetical protein